MLYIAGFCISSSLSFTFAFIPARVILNFCSPARVVPAGYTAGLYTAGLLAGGGTLNGRKQMPMAENARNKVVLSV